MSWAEDYDLDTWDEEDVELATSSPRYFRKHSKRENIMTQVVTGTIEDIITQQVKTSRGQATAYRVKISGKQYGHGFKKPEFQAGAQVSGVADQNANGYWEIKDLTLASAEAAPMSAPPPAKGYSAPAKSGPDWDKKDKQIIRQNALTQANKMFETKVACGDEVLVTPEAIIEEAEKFAAWVLKND